MIKEENEAIEVFYFKGYTYFPQVNTYHND